MKKWIRILTLVWLISLVAIKFINPNHAYYDKSYKVTINRIHSRFTKDIQKNLLIINSLNTEESMAIQSIEIVQKISSDIEDIWQSPVVYMPIEGSKYIVKYSIFPMKYRQNEEKVIVAFIITLAYLFIMTYLYILHRNIIKPMKKLSRITKALAAGNVVENNYLYKNTYFKDFIWGLDMLKEKLSYERNKNDELEMQRKTLVASLSHDIKTPLSSIKNYSIAMLENVYETENEKNMALNIILENTDVIDRLTKELLQCSSRTMKEINVQSKEVYLEEIHKRLNKLIYHKIELLHMEYVELNLDKNLMVIADIERLLEVFENLLNNALKYGDLKTLTVKFSTEENYSLIEIYNSGKLIPDPEIKHVFTSYYRGSNTGDKPGYGLGLYISKQIMKLMDGDIYIKNTNTGVSAVVVIKHAG
ncbi:hypothetical protein SH2C18_14330 [Clostridium sediminicola]|uniref:sensor histidine kinase n=1 Tax=Clostridium sediminicola TaxID=3114879 RepID=UPI0031F1F390